MGSLARRSGLYDVVEPAYARLQIVSWERAGRPLPAPSSAKRRLLNAMATRMGLDTLVETGTYKADTVRALRRRFSTIISIELSPDLHARAVRRCRRQPGAQLVLGDSAVVLPGILASLSGPALFWLDAHYSGSGTGSGENVSPIVAELDAVLGDRGLPHVVLIDDAREFREHNRTGYPPPEVVTAAAARHGFSVSEEMDVFILLPPERPRV